ncbi:MAG: deoxyribose-phosphate aldolase [Spirochaetales bacterium]|nr:deoxyribose-phosphate aldolase [Spirochaetales bacterium]
MNESDIKTDIARTNDALEKAGRPEIAFGGRARVDSAAGLARYFDHTLLKPEATEDRYRTLCEEAKGYGTRSVCVPPDRVALCAGLLRGSETEVCTVVGFPLGYHSAAAKVAEVEMAASQGATEFDMVIPIGRMRDGDPVAVYDDVRAVVAAAGEGIVKVILETALLDEAQKVRAAVAAVRAGAAILKTSTGFASSGATIEDLRMFRVVAGEERGVKAAGGIRDLAFTKACIEAGADRIGASATVAILEEAAGRTGASQSRGGDGY